MNNYKQLFKNRNFFSLWVGQFVSALGDRFTQMALLTVAMVLCADTGEKVAWITFYSLLPFLLFGQIFGIIGDRLSRKKLMILADILRAILVALIPFIIQYTSSFIYIYILIFCIGTLSALFLPAKMAIIPNLVAKDKCVSANSIIASTGMFCTLTGTLIAGYLIKWLGPGPVFFFNSFTFIISAIMIANIFVEAKPREKLVISLQNIFHGIKEGFGFINRHEVVFQIVQLNTIFSLLSSLFYITILNYSTVYLKLNPEGYGMLLACLGLGLSFGALLLGKRIGKLNYSRILLLGFNLVFLMGLFFLFRPNFIFSIALLIIGGIGASLIIITLDSLLQRSTPDSLRANVFGARGIITNAVFLVGLIGVGKILTKFNALYVFTFIAFVSFSVAFFIYFSQGPLGYRILRRTLRLILRIFFDLKITGLENLPKTTKVILAGNHTSLMDGVVLMSAYPKKVYFLAAESVFKRGIIGILARHLGFIPVKRGGLNKEALEEAIRLLESRHAIGIFPEGRITEDGKLIEGKKGVAALALKTGAAIIPFAIEGAYYAWPLPKKYPKRHPVEIRFGKPIDIEGYQIPEELVSEVMTDIRKIKQEMEYDGLLSVDPNVIVRHIINFG